MKKQTLKNFIVQILIHLFHLFKNGGFVSIFQDSLTYRNVWVLAGRLALAKPPRRVDGPGQSHSPFSVSRAVFNYMAGLQNHVVLSQRLWHVAYDQVCTNISLGPISHCCPFGRFHFGYLCPTVKMRLLSSLAACPSALCPPSVLNSRQLGDETSRLSGRLGHDRSSLHGRQSSRNSHLLGKKKAWYFSAGWEWRVSVMTTSTVSSGQ